MSAERKIPPNAAIAYRSSFLAPILFGSLILTVIALITALWIGYRSIQDGRLSSVFSSAILELPMAGVQPGPDGSLLVPVLHGGRFHVVQIDAETKEPLASFRHGDGSIRELAIVGDWVYAIVSTSNIREHRLVRQFRFGENDWEPVFVHEAAFVHLRPSADEKSIVVAECPHVASLGTNCKILIIDPTRDEIRVDSDWTEIFRAETAIGDQVWAIPVYLRQEDGQSTAIVRTGDIIQSVTFNCDPAEGETLFAESDQSAFRVISNWVSDGFQWDLVQISMYSNAEDAENSVLQCSHKKIRANEFFRSVSLYLTVMPGGETALLSTHGGAGFFEKSESTVELINLQTGERTPFLTDQDMRNLARFQ